MGAHVDWHIVDHYRHVGAVIEIRRPVCQNGVMDSVLHPIEPLAFRLTLTGVF